MDAVTLEALKGSIEKWEAIVAGTGEDRGGLNCPLCAEFGNAKCGGCPVADAVEEEWCNGTPYEQWMRKVTGERDASTGCYVRKAVTDEHKALARQELNFLVSLLLQYESDIAHTKGGTNGNG